MPKLQNLDLYLVKDGLHVLVLTIISSARAMAVKVKQAKIQIQ